MISVFEIRGVNCILGSQLLNSEVHSQIEMKKKKTSKASTNSYPKYEHKSVYSVFVYGKHICVPYLLWSDKPVELSQNYCKWPNRKCRFGHAVSYSFLSH